eukprot:61419-Heterocapsa_arctica.AAC.1
MHRFHTPHPRGRRTPSASLIPRGFPGPGTSSLSPLGSSQHADHFANSQLERLILSLKANML